MALSRLFGPQAAPVPQPEPKPPARTCAICKHKLAPIHMNPEPVCFHHVEEWNRGGKGAHVVRR